MANYDWFDDVRAKRDSVKRGLVSQMRANGYGIVWRERSPGAGSAWSVYDIQHLQCLWCGVLVWHDGLHRRSCTGPIVGDVEPPMGE